MRLKVGISGSKTVNLFSWESPIKDSLASAGDNGHPLNYLAHGRRPLSGRDIARSKVPSS